MLKLRDGWKDGQSLVDLNLDDLMKMGGPKKKDDLMKRMKRDGWMDDQSSDARNRGAVVSHPFRSPLFRF
jgi:hypothetical protein